MSSCPKWSTGSIVGVLIPIGAIWAVIEYRRQRRGSAVLQSGQRVSITYPSPGTRSWPPGWYGLLLGAVLAPAGLTTAGLGFAQREPAFAVPAVGMLVVGVLGLVSGLAGLTRRSTNEGVVVQRRRIPSAEGRLQDSCFIAVATGVEADIRGVQVTLQQYSSLGERDWVRLTTNPRGTYVYSVTIVARAGGERMP